MPQRGGRAEVDGEQAGGASAAAVAFDGAKVSRHVVVLNARSCEGRSE